MIKVVIIEDEMLIKKGLILTTPWEKYGCQVVGEGSNGKDGMKIIPELKPDIVLTDVKMPNMDGIKMIENLKGIVDTEYIIISGYTEFEYARNAVHLGVREYLVKPVSDRILEKSIMKTVNLVKQKRELEIFKNHLEHSDDSKIVLFREYFSDDNTKNSNHMNKAVSYLKMNYHKDISIKDVIIELHVSESYLSRLFKKESGYTFNDYLINYRINQACILLANSDLKIYQLAEKIGYKNQRYFSVIFKKLVGMTPGEFRNKVKGEK